MTRQGMLFYISVMHINMMGGHPSQWMGLEPITRSPVGFFMDDPALSWCETFLPFLDGKTPFCFSVQFFLVFLFLCFYPFLVVRPSRSLFSPPRLSWKINQTSNIEMSTIKSTKTVGRPTLVLKLTQYEDRLTPLKLQLTGLPVVALTSDFKFSQIVETRIEARIGN